MKSSPSMRPWSFVIVFGVISMLADIVYEGARSVSGPLLAALGASAILVGLITGVGEAAALVLRLVSGPLADRTGRYWALTVTGYAVAMISVPLIGLTGALWLVCALLLAERTGKAIRSPAKDALLASAAGAVGRGRGFAVHEALDQLGAVAGPLLVALLITAYGGIGPALATLALPGAAVLVILLWLRARVPDPGRYEPPQPAPAPGPAGPFPREFWLYTTFTALTLSGFATFGVLSFHLADRDLLGDAAIPLVYAAAMAVDAVAALITGHLYDRIGPRALIALPPLAAAVPVLALGSSVWPAIFGCLVWGAALGIQESTMRAVVADLVPPTRRATGYGVFAAASGGATLLGGLISGLLYTHSIPLLIAVTVAIQAAALALLRLSALAAPVRSG